MTPMASLALVVAVGADLLARLPLGFGLGFGLALAALDAGLRLVDDDVTVGSTELATKMGTLDLAALDLEGCEAASDLVDLTALDLRLDGAMQSVCTGEFGGRNDTSVVRRVSHRSRDFGSELIESNYCRVHKTNNSI